MTVLLTGAQARNAYSDILDGRKRLIAWGATSRFPYLLLRLPVLPHYIIDNDSRRWGSLFCSVPVLPPAHLEGEEAADCVVLILPDYSSVAVNQILNSLAEIGPFPCLLAGQMEADLPTICSLIAEQPERGKIVRLPPGCADVDGLLAPRSLATLLPKLAAWHRSAEERLAPVHPRRAQLITGHLQPGGAERQITYLATGLKSLGWDVELLTSSPVAAGAEHYAADLERDGICNVIAPYAHDLFCSTEAVWPFANALADMTADLAELLVELPLEIVHSIYATYRHLAQIRPELVICYLDTSNIAGAIAALMAGVPHILLSGRNLNPTHFPNHYGLIIGWLGDYYRALLTFPEIRMSANSAAGAQSYAEWLKPAMVTTVPNAVGPQTIARVSASEAAAIREEAGIAAETPLIAGVFRLAEEKQPLTFVATAARVHRVRPDVRFVVVGDGPLRDEMRCEADRCGLGDALILLGARQDARAVIASADLLLHTALAEGQPNTILEAQLLETPVVTTDGGGTRECLAPWLQGGVFPCGDVEKLAEGCLRVLDALAARTADAERARPWVIENFSIHQLAKRSLAAAGIPN
ncbi:glycosyltransferase [Azospirillum endophyticum]